MKCFQNKKYHFIIAIHGLKSYTMFLQGSSKNQVLNLLLFYNPLQLRYLLNSP